MAGFRTVFNHVGLRVADRDRSRRSYEGLRGFTFWWDLDLPDGAKARLLQLAGPIGVHATYVVRDRFVPELIDYSKRGVDTCGQRVMDEVN
jgi:lactoylglutathione lyase